MLHHRIASDIRDLFSTVGPSPSARLVPSAPTQPSGSPLAPHPRLLSFPTLTAAGRANVAGTRQGSSFFRDLLSASAARCAAFFAEAAVLVAVLGILDRFLLKERFELGWFSGSFAVALLLLAASIATDVTARRWLRVH